MFCLYILLSRTCDPLMFSFRFFFHDTAPTEIYTLSLHDALPIFGATGALMAGEIGTFDDLLAPDGRTGRRRRSEEHTSELSHTVISYAVFCLKKKKKKAKKN